jgi:hypothetical protein
MTADTETGIARGASMIALLAGLWLVVSPWVYGAGSAPNALNSWMTGGMIATFAFITATQPGSAFVSWVNVGLGAWTIASPWVQGFNLDGQRTANSLCIGVIVFLTAFLSARMGAHADRMRERYR